MKENYRQIAEKYFSKTLLPDEVVHHIDGNRENNSEENLVIMKKTQHLKLHGSLYSGLNEWQRKKKNGICNTCLFVSLFDLDKESTKEVLFDLAESIITNVKKTDRMLDILYQHSKEWKAKNIHDCYENENLQIVTQ